MFYWFYIFVLRSSEYRIDAVLIDLPVRRAETYAFSVPLTSVYSLIVHPPTLTSWRKSFFPVTNDHH